MFVLANARKNGCFPVKKEEDPKLDFARRVATMPAEAKARLGFRGNIKWGGAWAEQCRRHDQVWSSTI